MFQDEKDLYSEEVTPGNNFNKVPALPAKEDGTAANVGEATTELQVEFEVDDEGKIVSLDHQLNTDRELWFSRRPDKHILKPRRAAEALAQFVRSQAEIPPTFHLHVYGCHPETRTRTVQHYNEFTKSWETRAFCYPTSFTYG